MTTEKTIQILGKDVRLRYCAATENGFEQLRKKSVSEIDFKSTELVELIKTVIELRAAWYEIPAVVTPDPKPAEDDEEKQPKN